MFDNRILAGVVAGIPISALCLGYLALRRREVVGLLLAGEDAEGGLTPATATAVAIAVGVGIGPGLGLLASVVRGWVPSDGAYLALAVGLATLFSVAAVASRTPLVAEKIVLNYAVALMLGVVAPGLASRLA